MSDLEKMKEIFSRAGIKFSETGANMSGFRHLTLEANTPGVDGYIGFETIFSFGSEGNLDGVSIGE